MLEFYEFNTLNISIVLIGTFIIYNILCNIFDFSNSKSNADNTSIKQDLSIEYLIGSIIIAISISLIISYIISSKDESILTDNFWDPIVNETPN